MAGIAGIAEAGRQRQVKRMMKKISHRGSERTKTIEKHNVTMQASWSEIEERPVSSFMQRSAVWDGVFVPETAPEALACWTQPFGLAAVSPEGLFLARDPLGVKPLYYGRVDGAMAFASEVKVLLTVTDDVNEFPPGNWYTPRDGFRTFAKMKPGAAPDCDVNGIADELRRRLAAAVVRRIVTDEMGVWLSGGVDSSVIAALARPHVRVLRSFVSGVEGAPDIDYGGRMAEFLGTRHHVLTITLDDLLAALPDVIYHLESFDALLVRSSVTNYLASKMAADYVGAVLSGEGGDELFAGYDYIKEIPAAEIPAELDDIIGRLHNTAFQRMDRCAHAHGLVPFVPFADMDVVKYALSIPARYKICSRKGALIEKWILRRSAAGLVPESVLWRPKAKFWQGAGVQELLARHAASAISDRDFRSERKLSNGWTLNSKEELMYYRIFREHFGAARRLDWMGRTKGSPVQ